MMALVEIVLNTGDNCFCHVSRQAKEFYRFTKEITLIVYNFTEINDYTIPHGGFDRISPALRMGITSVPYCIYFESKQLE